MTQLFTHHACSLDCWLYLSLFTSC